MACQHHFLAASIGASASEARAWPVSRETRTEAGTPDFQERIGVVMQTAKIQQPIKWAKASPQPLAAPTATARIETAAIIHNDHTWRGGSQRPPYVRRFQLRGARDERPNSYAPDNKGACRLSLTPPRDRRPADTRTPITGYAQYVSFCASVLTTCLNRPSDVPEQAFNGTAHTKYAVLSVHPYVVRRRCRGEL